MNLDEKNYPNLSDFLFFKSKKGKIYINFVEPVEGFFLDTEAEVEEFIGLLQEEKKKAFGK